MKLPVIGAAFLAGLAFAAPAVTSEHHVTKRQAITNFAGTNAYWLPFLTNDADVETAFAAIADAGLKVVRTWAFNDATSCSGVYFQCWSDGTPTINTGADGLERLDVVVQTAEKHGIQLILPFVNNWGDYGGMDVYVSQLGGAGHADFYTNEAIQAAYTNYLDTIVNRYKDSSAIYGWELANEPRCQGCETSVITEWARTTSAHIKSLDSAHYVLLGDEGFFNDPGNPSYPYQGGEGIDFVANLGIETLDVGTIHLYTESWSQTYEWGSQWIADHSEACVAAGKVCILEEYGVPEDGEPRNTWMNAWHETLNNSPGIPADMYWQFGLELSNGPTHDDTYTIYNTDDNFQALVVDWTASRA
ncbi:hypothetical protein FQN55_005633 [Onygenales sp. PD_40]|nr:hypothetical protein FQN55_005633 [Onygenales sp. PD_40]KAK2780015.1 hypothetical protein FQN53_001130 [Emmonsiellopsis sp. PD_33]KAK2783393.1 hypothetical protein FQN52_009651 [Onygenales sp. PD_12]KAK2792330.1 hypothetical protein FQN51_001722 [Onygenales sp. PD_10]